MNLIMGGQRFSNVEIPVLWGSRAVLRDDKSRLSILDLGGQTALIEILGDEPGPDVPYRVVDEGFVILSESGEELYEFSPSEALLTAVSLDLPSCQIAADRIVVGGTATFQSNSVVGFGVGIAIYDGGGIAMGAPLPPALAQLRV